MKTHSGRAAVAAMLLAGMAWGQVELSEMTGFRVPEYDKNGNKTSELTGDLARMNDDGDVEVTNLRMELYKDDAVDTLVTAPSCTYNQEKGIAYSRTAVRMERDKMVLTGKGFAYSHSNGVFKIFSDAKVVIVNAREHGDVMGGKP